MIKIAHRGYVNKDCPENSYSSISKAIDLGYDMVEIDIRRTKDNKIVLAHDENLTRLFGINKKVSNVTWKEIKGTNFINSEDTIFTLEECLILCKEKIGLLIEVKDNVYPENFLEQIYQLIEKNKMTEQVLIYPPREELIDFYIGKLKVGIKYDELYKIEEEDLKEKVFVIGMPYIWDLEKVNNVHAKDLICLTTVKKIYFDRNYPDYNHFKLAEKAINNLKEIGLDAIHIDACYHDLLF